MRNPMPPPPVKPLGVDDESYQIIMRAAAPLARGLRDLFLEDVASTLHTIGDPGPGALYRLVRELQRKYWDPPIDVGHQRVGKYGRA
jgi:hypothetical protein